MIILTFWALRALLISIYLQLRHNKIFFICTHFSPKKITGYFTNVKDVVKKYKTKQNKTKSNIQRIYPRDLTMQSFWFDRWEFQISTNWSKTNRSLGFIWSKMNTFQIGLVSRKVLPSQWKMKTQDHYWELWNEVLCANFPQGASKLPEVKVKSCKKSFLLLCKFKSVYF